METDKLAELFRFLLLVGGLIYILTRSIILRFVRMYLGGLWLPLTALLYCPSCSGFWFGAAMCHLWPWRTGHLYGLEAAVVSCLLGSILAGIWDDTYVQAELTKLAEHFTKDGDDGSEKKAG